MLGRFIVCIFLSGLLGSCWSVPKNNKTTTDGNGSSQKISAKGFFIEDFEGYRKLTVKDPWQKSKDNLFEYYLVQREGKIPDVLKGRPVFLTPLERVVCLSTTHIGYLDALEEVNAIIGLSGCGYITNPQVKKGVAENRIHEVGYEQGLNIELILQLKPDAVFAYGVGAEINAQVNKLNDLGIPVVLVGEYLEKSPVSKAEWIKFFGSFFMKAQKADTVFRRISDNYERTRIEAARIAEKPSVLTGLPFKDTWWMAGGQSNLAVLIADAGGNFLWSDNPSEEAFPVALEEVFMRAAKADYWINCGSVKSMDELLACDLRFSRLPAVRNKRVFNNNLRAATDGGNDYWESGVVHPDLVLADLVKILHPRIYGEDMFYYYRKIQ